VKTHSLAQVKLVFTIVWFIVSGLMLLYFLILVPELRAVAAAGVMIGLLALLPIRVKERRLERHFNISMMQLWIIDKLATRPMQTVYELRQKAQEETIPAPLGLLHTALKWLDEEDFLLTTPFHDPQYGDCQLYRLNIKHYDKHGDQWLRELLYDWKEQRDALL
jgi:hypothetical protein